MTVTTSPQLDATASAPLAPALPRKGWLQLTPINQRRLDTFCRNRRGYWSFWILLVMFVGSLFGEFLINDSPIIASYKGEIIFPIFNQYPEEKFGGFLAVTDFRDPVIIKEIEANGWMVWPPVRYSYNTHNLNPPTPAPTKPTWLLDKRSCEIAARRDGITKPGAGCGDIEWNWLGTDDQSRDVLARLVYGFRLSIVFGLVLAGISSIIGIIAGAVQGFYGGWLDLVFQRFIEIWTSLPHLYVLIILSASIVPGFFSLLFILLAFSWVNLVHLVRAEFLRARNLEYVNAARALGLSNFKIMFRHMLPNAMVATLTFLPFVVNASISTLTSLDYLGLGLPPGSASLGEMLLQGKSNLSAPWLGLTGFFIIATMLSLLIFIGEAVRDAFDPRKTFS